MILWNPIVGHGVREGRSRHHQVPPLGQSGPGISPAAVWIAKIDETNGARYTNLTKIELIGKPIRFLLYLIEASRNAAPLAFDPAMRLLLVLTAALEEMKGGSIRDPHTESMTPQH